jgi:hypothetical protein
MKAEQLETGATVRRCIRTPDSLRAIAAALHNADVIKVRDLLGRRLRHHTQIYDSRRRSNLRQLPAIEAIRLASVAGGEPRAAIPLALVGRWRQRTARTGTATSGGGCRPAIHRGSVSSAL